MAKTKSIQTGVKVQLSNKDGNIFAIIGRASQALRIAGFKDEAKEMSSKAMKTHSYQDALDVIADYVEVY